MSTSSDDNAIPKHKNDLLKHQPLKKNSKNKTEFHKNEYRSLYHNVPIGIMHYDKVGIILDCNEVFVNIIGSSYKQLVGLDMINFLHDNILIDAIKQSLITGNGKYEGVYKSITAGKETPVKIIFNGIKNEENEITGGICIAEDMTESISNKLALRKSEEDYKLIFENTTDVYYRTDKNGIVLSMSPAVTELLLIDHHEDLIGKSVIEYYNNPNDRILFLEELKKHGKVQEYRVDLKRTNGELIPVEFNTKLIYDKDGKLDSIIGVFYDVSSRVDAEKEKSTNIWFFERLDKIDKVIRTAINNTQIYQGVASTANEAFQSDSVLVFSYKADTVDNWKLEASVLSENYTCDNNPATLLADPKKSDEIFDRILMYETLVIVDSENNNELSEISKKMGVQAQMMTSIHLSSGNSLILCINHCKDKRKWNNHEKALFNEMTNRLADAINTMESTELLFKSEEHHRTLIEATSEGYWETNKAGITTLANKAMCDMLGFSMADFIGKSALIFPSPDSRQLLENIIYNINVEMPKSFEIELLHKNGNKVFTLFNGTRRKDENNNNTGAFFFVTDISKQKEALDKAEESDKLKSIFIKNISHEVRTPLNGIIGFLEMLNEESLTKTERSEYTEYVIASSNQLTTIITDILEYSRLEAGQIDTAIHVLNLNYLMDELYKQFTSFIESKNKNHITLILDKPLSDENSNIKTDKVKVKHILSSLLNNAVKFTQKGEIRFGYKFLDSDNIHFFVTDTGIGIPDNDREIIFDKFRNGSNTNSAIYGGNGLGLSISKSLTELLNGLIWFKSEVGIGTSFYVNIPISENGEIGNNKYIAPQIKSSSKLADKKILIVDDVFEVYKLISAYLLNTKAKHLYAKNGAQAIELCNQNPDIDIVLLDIQLPDISGYEVVKAIKSIRKDLPVIAQTAFALSEDKEKTLLAGFDEYITKPINKNTLLKLINKFL